MNAKDAGKTKTVNRAGARPGSAKQGSKAASGKVSGKKSGSRFILIVGDEGVILVFMNGSKVVRRLFAPSAQPSHTEAIRDIMNGNPKVPIYMLVDVLDQQYIPHTFPPVSSLSVGGLVKRRIDRDFQPEDLKGALPLGREKTGRKEWKFLLVSLARTPIVSEWIDLIVEMPNELKGVYLVPIESIKYIERINKKSSNQKPLPWQLLISHNKVSGFRQVVVRDGNLVFTRVSQVIDDAVAAVIAGNVEQEIINTMEYLKRLEFRDTADLEVNVIISSDVGELTDLKRFNFGIARVLSPMNVADALGLDQAALAADRFGDVVMAAAFGIEKKHVLRFSNAYINKLAILYKASMAARAVAALAVIALIGLIGATMLDISSDFTSIAKAQQETESLGTELSKAKAAKEALNQDVVFKSTVAATYDVYMKNTIDPIDFAHDIAPFISAQQRLIKLTWEYTVDDSKVVVAPSGPNAKLPLKVVAEFDFSGSGTTVEELTDAANKMIAAMKAKLPQYEIKPDPYPWQKDTATSESVALNSADEGKVSNPIALITFTGVKAAAPQAPQVPNPPPGNL